MSIVHIDRRAAASLTNTDADTDMVRQALLIQARLGTVGAVEYLKTHAIDGAVIRRVLASGRVRAGDRLRD